MRSQSYSSTLPTCVKSNASLAIQSVIDPYFVNGLHDFWGCSTFFNPLTVFAAARHNLDAELWAYDAPVTICAFNITAEAINSVHNDEEHANRYTLFKQAFMAAFLLFHFFLSTSIVLVVVRSLSSPGASVAACWLDGTSRDLRSSRTLETQL
ncbi:hypothetical protein BDQ12DRAFT_723602 [Crucibulum laeve]|uniref:Uncharacterized protein n=1 Tax=Crucibulum laeve TaxID=68775 RepID=A0A5C3LYS1_9AGAR|nr:hypothetical protein BDQ12DRAFT_723602 [Crucibulum laeve]